MAVQTTYGVLLPLDVVHSCSDMSTTLMLSDMRFSSSLGSGSLELASEIQAEADSDAQPLLFGSFEEEEQVCCLRVLQDNSTPPCMGTALGLGNDRLKQQLLGCWSRQ